MNLSQGLVVPGETLFDAGVHHTHPNSHPCTRPLASSLGLGNSPRVHFDFIPGATRALLSVSPNHEGNVTRMSPEPFFYYEWEALVNHAFHQMNK